MAFVLIDLLTLDRIYSLLIFRFYICDWSHLTPVMLQLIAYFYYSFITWTLCLLLNFLWSIILTIDNVEIHRIELLSPTFRIILDSFYTRHLFIVSVSVTNFHCALPTFIWQSNCEFISMIYPGNDSGNKLNSNTSLEERTVFMWGEPAKVSQLRESSSFRSALWTNLRANVATKARTLPRKLERDPKCRMRFENPGSASSFRRRCRFNISQEVGSVKRTYGTSFARGPVLFLWWFESISSITSTLFASCSKRSLDPLCAYFRVNLEIDKYDRRAECIFEYVSRPDLSKKKVYKVSLFEPLTVKVRIVVLAMMKIVLFRDYCSNASITWSSNPFVSLA